MNENERVLITSALAIISQTVEASERDERSAYNNRLNVEQKVREEVDAAWKEKAARLNGELHDARERIHYLLPVATPASQENDQEVQKRQRLEDYASETQRGLNELVDLVRTIKNTCKGHRDSECSKQVCALIDGYFEKLRERCPRHVEASSPQAEHRSALDASRDERIAKAKAATGEPILVPESEQAHYFVSKDGGEVLHVDAPMVKSRSQLDHMRGKKFSSVKVNGSWRTEDLAQYAADVLGPLTRSE